MKLKNFIKKPAFKKGVSESLNMVAPLYLKYYARFKNRIQRRPKRTLLILLFIATANFALLLFVVNHSKKPTIGLAYQKTKMALFTSGPGVDFSISNYLKLKDLKDSLEIIMHKQTMTREDTLLFIRIYQQYEKVDPDFSKQLNKYAK